MLSSMTGFGAAACREDGVSVSVELKTVNNRFFKLSLRINDAYAAFEPKIESLLRGSIERGTVGVTVKIRCEKNASDCKLSLPALRSYFGQLVELNSELGAMDPPRLDLLALLPGVAEFAAERDEDGMTAVWTVVEKALREAQNALLAMRRTEGASMANDLKANIALLRDLVGNVEKLAPGVAPAYRQRLAERIGKLMADQGVVLSDTDLVREVALLADRSDISEETVRFRSHLEQFESAMHGCKNGEVECCGKKLDFLTQELFRETNTMGSKANDAEITRNVVEMKTVIERIREMVQNVE